MTQGRLPPELPPVFLPEPQRDPAPPLPERDPDRLRSGPQAGPVPQTPVRRRKILPRLAFWLILAIMLIALARTEYPLAILFLAAVGFFVTKGR